MYTVPVGQNPSGVVSSGILVLLILTTKLVSRMSLSRVRRRFTTSASSTVRACDLHYTEIRTYNAQDIIIVEDDPYYFQQFATYNSKSAYASDPHNIEKYLSGLVPSYLK
jgi:hypothetical protein